LLTSEQYPVCLTFGNAFCIASKTADIDPPIPKTKEMLSIAALKLNEFVFVAVFETMKHSSFFYCDGQSTNQV
ncbi:hypothetical protein, partial [Leuconostoc pseudomesenteroides]|uniref:hypothetical protein n=1 Tax=Leuconostoc pseudomesenteroides TaxID=33968 RepID=UPI0040365FE8